MKTVKEQARKWEIEFLKRARKVQEIQARDSRLNETQLNGAAKTIRRKLKK